MPTVQDRQKPDKTSIHASRGGKVNQTVTNFFSSLTHAYHAFSFHFSFMIGQTFTTRQTCLLHMHTSLLHYDLHVFAAWLTHFSYLFKPVVR